MTYADAINQGYHVSDITTQRGYISRKLDIAHAEVKAAGGNRKGQLYVLVPNFGGTRYCYRWYLSKTEKGG